jgi:hypothetical protein
MTPSEAVFALSSLVAATPGWSDSTVEEYVAQLEPLTDPNALLRATHSIARAWTEMRRPPIATILESYDRECLLASNAIEPSRVHCDGSGWVPEEGEGLVPCRRCQPALARVWDDPDKLDRFRRGTAIQHLDVGVEAVHDRLRYTDGHRPPVCHPFPDRPEDYPTMEGGLDIAWRAYAAQAEEEGRPTSRRHFDQLTGRIDR